MNIVSRTKKLALCMSFGLLFVASASYAAQYTYIPSNVKVDFSNTSGQKDSLVFQQGGKLETSGINTYNFSGGFNDSNAFGLSDAVITDTASTTVTSDTQGVLPEQVNSNANAYYLLNGLLTVANPTDVQNLQSGAGYTLTDAISVSISGSGVSIPSGNYKAGTKFAVTGPVSVTTVAGTTETDTFTGKIVLGEVRGIRDAWGNLTGTRMNAIHITGSLTDSAGETYKIDQVVGQNDLNGITPDQLTLNYTLTQQ
ncbi:hypothetical protein DWU98_10875 [Dyella monticola]|uniref:DUF4402 domain-containing protein n=1 Tax=Dyella monticola TaxID=1927958 RepID=A0A370WZW8_9GAMM|nr:hypothetical protein [Dyella monticola]RDS81713.1 hypothetical protein DWU98_10875 [Dyella monticola]